MRFLWMPSGERAAIIANDLFSLGISWSSRPGIAVAIWPMKRGWGLQFEPRPQLYEESWRRRLPGYDDTVVRRWPGP